MCSVPCTVNTRPALFWIVTQRVVVILYRRFGTISLFHIKGSRIQEGFLTLEDGTAKLSHNINKELPLLTE
jgi:hypothetical protein